VHLYRPIEVAHLRSWVRTRAEYETTPLGDRSTRRYTRMTLGGGGVEHRTLGYHWLAANRPSRFLRCPEKLSTLTPHLLSSGPLSEVRDYESKLFELNHVGEIREYPNYWIQIIETSRLIIKKRVKKHQIDSASLFRIRPSMFMRRRMSS
jgi:hypothetical protein